MMDLSERRKGLLDAFETVFAAPHVVKVDVFIVEDLLCVFALSYDVFFALTFFDGSFAK